jgi:hypothetical protein
MNTTTCCRKEGSSCWEKSVPELEMAKITREEDKSDKLLLSDTEKICHGSPADTGELCH